MGQQKLSVFISYASEDLSHAKNIATILSNLGYSPWLDKDKLLPGYDWKLEIEKAVQEADTIIICLSKLSTNKRGYVQKEIKKALDVADEQPEGRIFLIPTRLEPCQVPHQLNNKQWVDIFEPNGMTKLIEALKTKAKELGVSVIPKDHEDPLVGEYFVSGNNPDGSNYAGKAIISPQDENYLVTWYVADEHFEAEGTHIGNELIVRGDYNFSYRIGDNNLLESEWNKDAFEQLTKIIRNE